MMRVMRQMPNWKAPGPDNVQGHWLQNDSITWQVSGVFLRLSRLWVPDWLTRRRTVFIQKKTAKENIANNYRPITCLPFVWKLLTVILANEIYDYLKKKILLPEVQKGCSVRGQAIYSLLLKQYLGRCEWERKTQ